MLYGALLNGNLNAQVRENTLKYITNQTNANALTRAQISVGERPIFIETFGDYIYVANIGSPSDFGNNDTVSVIDARNNTVINTITVGEEPGFVTADDIYVANSGSDTISAIRLMSLRYFCLMHPIY
jgi:YVTN family beta-propeller protein